MVSFQSNWFNVITYISTNWKRCFWYFVLKLFKLHCFSFDKFELLILVALKKFVKLGSFFLFCIWHFFQIFRSFGSFHLVHLLKAQMKLNSQKWLYEMEQRNSEKNHVFGTESQMVLFTCWLLIPEQILWLDIHLIRLNVF